MSAPRNYTVVSSPTRMSVVMDILALVNEAMAAKDYQHARVYAEAGYDMMKSNSYKSDADVPVHKPDEITALLARMADAEAAIVQFPSLKDMLANRHNSNDYAVMDWFRAVAYDTVKADEPEVITITEAEILAAIDATDERLPRMATD